jgi:hypothetical protein
MLNTGGKLKKINYQKKKIGILIALFVSTIAIIGLSSFAGTSTKVKADQIAETAKSKVGATYLYGAQGDEKFDSSGFVWWVYQNKNGVNLGTNRLTADDYFKVGTKVERSNLEAGDLVFFVDNYGPAQQVGIYLGANTFIHASGSYGKVVISSFSDHLANLKTHLSDSKLKTYEASFVGARRVLGVTNINQGVAAELKVGDNNSEVKDIQTNLNALGYTVPRTGDFDADTASAVQNLQKDYSLKETGVVDSQTMEVIRELKLVHTCPVCTP